MSSLQNPMQAFDGLPIRQAVFRQIFPAVASQMITLIYNLADTFFVGLLNQPSQTAAITVVYSPFLMLTAISNLFGVGGASALARALGHKAPDKAREIAAISFWWGAGASLVFCALFWVFAAPILSLCGATADTLPIALGYPTGSLRAVLEAYQYAGRSGRHDRRRRDGIRMEVSGSSHGRRLEHL